MLTAQKKPLAQYAAQHLGKNYKYPATLLFHGYCPTCLKNGKGKRFDLGRNKDKELQWNVIFDCGADPAQVLLYTSDSNAAVAQQGRLLNFSQPGTPCNNTLTCDARCPLCYHPLGGSAKVTMSQYPGSQVHQICCMTCPVKGCTELVPRFPKSVVPFDPENLINVCAKHASLSQELVSVATAPFVPIRSDREVAYFQCPVKHTALFKPTAVAGKTKVVTIKEGPHMDLGSWISNPTSSKTKPVKATTEKPAAAAKAKKSVFLDIDAPGTPSLLPAELLHRFKSL